MVGGSTEIEPCPDRAIAEPDLVWRPAKARRPWHPLPWPPSVTSWLRRGSTGWQIDLAGAESRRW